MEERGLKSVPKHDSRSHVADALVHAYEHRFLLRKFQEGAAPQRDGEPVAQVEGTPSYEQLLTLMSGMVRPAASPAFPPRFRTGITACCPDRVDAGP